MYSTFAAPSAELDNSKIEVSPLTSLYAVHGTGTLLEKRKRNKQLLKLLADNPRLAALTANNLNNSIET